MKIEGGVKETECILDLPWNSLSQFFFPRRQQESEALDANEIPDPFIIVSFECFTAVRLSGGTYGVRDTRSQSPLKCCKVFNIFGSVRVPRRLKSSSSHHWPNCLRRWIRNWGVKSRTSRFGSFVKIYPARGEPHMKRSPHLPSTFQYFFRPICHVDNPRFQYIRSGDFPFYVV